MSYMFDKAVKTCTERVEDAKNEIARKIISKFKSNEIEAIEQRNSFDKYESVCTFWHVPSKTKLASIVIKFEGTKVNIVTWFNEEVI